MTSVLSHNAGTTSVAQRLAYTAFGSIGSIKDGQGNNVTAGPISRFAYTGREFDPETGDYYYRARYFDPQTGRFLSQDPIGFAAGDMNLYRYVSNSTPNFTDPTGLAASGYVNNVPTNPGPRPPVSSTMGAGPQGSISGYTPSNPFGNDNLPTMTTEGFGDPLPGSDPLINIPEPNPIGIVTPIDWDPTRPSTPHPEPIHPIRPGDIPGMSGPNDRLIGVGLSSSDLLGLLPGIGEFFCSLFNRDPLGAALAAVPGIPTKYLKEIIDWIRRGIPDLPPSLNWIWKGTGEPSTGKGSWVNKTCNVKVRPDFDHNLPIGPHADLIDEDKIGWRVFPGGGYEPKKPRK